MENLIQYCLHSQLQNYTRCCFDTSFVFGGFLKSGVTFFLLACCLTAYVVSSKFDKK